MISSSTLFRTFASSFPNLTEASFFVDRPAVYFRWNALFFLRLFFPPWSVELLKRCCILLHPRTTGHHPQAMRWSIGTEVGFSQSIALQAFFGIFTYSHHVCFFLVLIHASYLNFPVPPKFRRHFSIRHLGTRPVEVQISHFKCLLKHLTEYIKYFPEVFFKQNVCKKSLARGYH